MSEPLEPRPSEPTTPYEPTSFSPQPYNPVDYGSGVAPPAVPSGQPPVPTSSGGRVGQAVGVEMRREALNLNSHAELSVLAFRLVSAGSPHPLDVVMRGRSISGTVRDGDWVEVSGKPDGFGRHDVTVLRNRTTGALVTAVGGPARGPAKVVAVVVAVLFILVALLIFVGVITTMVQS